MELSAQQARAFRMPAEVRAEMGISRERMSRLFSVSAKTIERWETNQQWPSSPSSREKLAAVEQVVELGQLVYGDTGLRHFLTSPIAALAWKTPLQLLERGEEDQVLSLLAQDYEGSGA